MRHLFKSLFMTLVVTAGAVLAMLILLNHSFFDARVNTITFWCIVVLLACIWGAFIGEVRETTKAQKPETSPDEAMEKLVEAAALSKAAEEAQAPFAEAAPPEAAPEEAAPAAPAGAPETAEQAPAPAPEAQAEPEPPAPEKAAPAKKRAPAARKKPAAKAAQAEPGA
ncbi:hypothetical protein, partial [Allofournierella sp.]